jgi:hypothetical protein
MHHYQQQPLPIAKIAQLMDKIVQLKKKPIVLAKGIMKLAVSLIKATFYQDLGKMLMQLHCKKCTNYQVIMQL